MYAVHEPTANGPSKPGGACGTDDGDAVTLLEDAPHRVDAVRLRGGHRRCPVRVRRVHVDDVDVEPELLGDRLDHAGLEVVQVGMSRKYAATFLAPKSASACSGTGGVRPLRCAEDP